MRYLLLLMAVLGGCTTDADIASRNLSKAADQFEIGRRIVFLNGVTDTYILVIEGMCSINALTSQLSVTCKTGPTHYKKHFLGLSDNVTYFSEQLEGSKTGVHQYRVIFKPSAIIPDIEIH